MKRLIVSLMVVAGALLSACTEEEEPFQVAGLSGAYDVALVDPEDEGPALLFVTSVNNNELRVLSLEEAAADRRFIRAPNPIQPLAIPVLPRPQSLTRDVRYDENGAERSGLLVFARSSGSTELSVVSGERDVLREVRRLQTTRRPDAVEGPLGPVTAFAAQAPEQANGETRLFFATQETTGAKLWLARLPSRDTLLAEAGLPEAERTAVTAAPLPGFSLPDNVAVNSLLVLPGPVGVGHRGVLAVATRGAAGTVYRVDLGTEAAPAVVTQPLNFGGAQVLQLATHGRVEYDVVVQTYTDPGTDRSKDVRVTETRTLEAGARIFGILDPSNCGVLLQCTGVLAVDVATGQVAKDRTAKDANGNFVNTYEMLPITSGAGLPMGLSLATGRNLRVQPGEPVDRLATDPAAANRQRGLTLPVLGIVPLSNGTILFFDALNLIHLNVRSIWASGQQENAATASISLTNAQGTAQSGKDYVTFEGTFGVTRDQTYALTYQGLLPDMVEVKRVGGAFKVPYEPRAGKGPVVQPRDLITLLPGVVGRQPCATEVRVLAVQPPAAGETLATLVPEGDLPADCPEADYGFFQVRAASAQSLVLSSTAEDYIARLGADDDYPTTGPYFFHPPGYAGQTEGTAVRIRVVGGVNLDDPNKALGLNRGDRYVVSIDSHFFPYIISVDTNNPSENVAFFRLPGPVVQATVGNIDYAYIAYPSANGILEVDMTSITAGVANSRGLFPYL